MKVHRNAKTTPHMRALLVDRILVQHWRPTAAAEAAGVSVRTVYKWLARYRFAGRGGLEDRSSSPTRQPRRTPPERVAAIVAARHARLTAWAIAVRLQVPRSTVARVLVRVGLNRLARLTPPPPVVRYERRAPGELLHLDIKPLARILRVGHRIHGDRSTRVYGAGWEYVHVAIDDFSRVAYAEVLPDQRGPGRRPSSAAPSIGLPRAASPFVGCSPTTEPPTRATAFTPPRTAPRSVCSRRASIGPKPTGRLSASFKPCCGSGPTSARIPARGNAPKPFDRGCGITTPRGSTPRSTTTHRASVCRGPLSE